MLLRCLIFWYSLHGTNLALVTLIRFPDGSYAITHLKDGGALSFCTFCSYSTAYKGNLKTHMLVHTGERRYACSICKKSFSLKGNLKTHMRIHSGERPYECNVCNKKFTQQTALTSHQRSHLKQSF
ncbi:UNVERIFIED_CONTAM: zinc finger protein [Trichonephila clavipes]